MADVSLVSDRPASGATADAPSLPPRAAIALLTLQLRACEQEALTAEAEEAAADGDHARRQLRARLEPLVDDRRRVLVDELARERALAADAIAAAQRDAALLASAPLLPPTALSVPSAPATMPPKA